MQNFYSKVAQVIVQARCFANTLHAADYAESAGVDAGPVSGDARKRLLLLDQDSCSSGITSNSPPTPNPFPPTPPFPVLPSSSFSSTSSGGGGGGGGGAGVGSQKASSTKINKWVGAFRGIALEQCLEGNRANQLITLLWY